MSGWNALPATPHSSLATTTRFQCRCNTRRQRAFAQSALTQQCNHENGFVWRIIQVPSCFPRQSDKRAQNPLVLLAPESVLAFASTTRDSKPCDCWEGPRTTLRKHPDILQQGGIKSIVAGNFNRSDAASKVEATNVDLVASGRQFTASLSL